MRTRTRSSATRTRWTGTTEPMVYILLPDRIEVEGAQAEWAAADRHGQEVGHFPRKIDAARAAEFFNRYGRAHDLPYTVEPIKPRRTAA